jgi:predicted phage terminase large subunit-like protein
MPRPIRSTQSQRHRMKVLLAEALARGIDIPTEISDNLSGIKSFQPFPKSPLGYYYKKDGTEYKPNEKQEAFIRSNAKYSLLNSARGGGKTAAGSQKSLFKIEEGQSGMIINPDFENLKISTWPEFRSWIPWNQVIPKHRRMGNEDWFPMQPFSISFVNGAQVTLKGVNDPDSARGPNINWLWLDECGRSDVEGLSWKIAIASVRIGKNPQAWATGTPNGKDHWVYKFFIEKDVPPETIKLVSEYLGKEVSVDDLIEVIHTNITDNKDNLDPMFYASLLMAYPDGWLRQQELFGEFADRGSVLGNPRWFDGKILKYVPTEIKSRIRFWDLAATEKKISGKRTNDPDETVGTKMSWSDNKVDFYVEDQVAGFWEWSKIKETILHTAIMDGPYVTQWFEEEPGAGGKNQVAELTEFLRKNIPNLPMPKSWRPEGDKIMRANVWFAEAQNGHIFLIEGSWNKAFLDQLSSFPIGRHDDRIDSISGARHTIAPIRTWKQINFLSL